MLAVAAAQHILAVQAELAALVAAALVV